MDKIKFKEFLIASRNNERISWHWEDSKPYAEILNEIYDDVSKFKYYTHNGKFQSLLVELLKDKKYEEGYQSLLQDIESYLNKYVEKAMLILPINFIEIKKDIEYNDFIKLFIPTKNDIKEYNDNELRKRQELRDRGKLNDNLSLYFQETIRTKLNKEHILLAKDRFFFNYPVLTITMSNIPSRIEKESGRIAEAVYSLIRIIDFMYEEDQFSHGLFDTKWIAPAGTYVVYYKGENNMSFDENSCYGYSFRYSFSKFLDIDTKVFIENFSKIGALVELYIKTCFLDTRKINSNDLNFINKWNNAIIMFNTAFEFASIEKFDACCMMLCSILESLFLKNEGVQKKKRLSLAIEEFFKSFMDSDRIEKRVKVIESIYKYRNAIMHEGIGYEYKFIAPRSINSNQSAVRGTRPFKYQGSIYPHEDVVNLIKGLKYVGEILISEKFTNKISEIVIHESY
ncbi:MAG: hypothetical protein IKM43_00890 [Clostridia bacterium]|nr:hypothetical protein [Clostridia bacterium]